MDLQAGLIQPFLDFGFMRHAALASAALALSAAPLGCLLVLRRMSLVGEAIAHALLPGAALAYALAGLSVAAMSLGSFFAAALVAALAGWSSRRGGQDLQAGFSAFYLIALAAGVLLLARLGGGVDLLQLLFGSVLAIDGAALAGIAAVSALCLLALALAWRPLVIASVDPGHLESLSPRLARALPALLLGLLVLHLVAALQGLGSLMAIGQLMLPPLAARLWTRRLGTMVALAAAIGLGSALGGLLLSFHAELPSGPAIVALAGAVYLVSLLLAPWRRGSASRLPVRAAA